MDELANPSLGKCLTWTDWPICPLGQGLIEGSVLRALPRSEIVMRTTRSRPSRNFCMNTGVNKMKRFVAIDTRETTVFDVVVAKDLITAVRQMYERVYPQYDPRTFPFLRAVSFVGGG